jgi:hypothetical protein
MGHFLDVGAFLNEARSTPKNGHRQFDPLLPKSANFGLMHRNKGVIYSITLIGASDHVSFGQPRFAKTLCQQLRV